MYPPINVSSISPVVVIQIEIQEMDPDKRAFYRWAAMSMEPWDGPGMQHILKDCPSSNFQNFHAFVIGSSEKMNSAIFYWC